MKSEEPKLYRLIMLLRTGGTLVRGVDCTTEEIDEAIKQQRFVMDKDGHSYLWRPEKDA